MELEKAARGPWSYYYLREMEEAGIIHGFMTRTSDAVLREARLRDALLAAFSAREMVVMDQEHGIRVHVVDSGARPRAGDGLVMKEPGVMGIIKTADCVPVILCAPSLPAAAIVHAGWRGTAAGIVKVALSAMAGMGVAPSDVTALIGPGIGPCCYNVGQDVVSAFEASGLGHGIFEERGGLTFLDLKEANRRLLMGEGVGRVIDAGLCTSCREDLFYSARRDKLGGRQMNFVLLAESGAP